MLIRLIWYYSIHIILLLIKLIIFVSSNNKCLPDILISGGIEGVIVK